MARILAFCALLLVFVPLHARAETLLAEKLQAPGDEVAAFARISDTLAVVGKGALLAATSYALRAATSSVLATAVDLLPGLSRDGHIALTLLSDVLVMPALTAEVTRWLWGAQQQPSWLRVFLRSAGARVLVLTVGWLMPVTTVGDFLWLLIWGLVGGVAATLTEVVAAKPERPALLAIPFDFVVALGALGIPWNGRIAPQMGGDLMLGFGPRREGVGSLLVRLRGGAVPARVLGQDRNAGTFAEIGLQYRTPISFDAQARPFGGAWIGYGADGTCRPFCARRTPVTGLELGVAIPLSAAWAGTMSAQLTAFLHEQTNVLPSIAIGLQHRGAD